MHFAHVISGSRLGSVTTTTCGRQASAAPAARQHDQLTGVALMTGSAVSVQLGAATAALAFPVLGPAGVVAIRQWVAGAVLLSSVRPKFRSFTRRQWRPVLALALIFATMNLCLYVAIDTIGLGLAVTLEFLGPLSVALLASRRAVDLGCALAAAAAVVVLARPQPTTDYAGIGLALLAAPAGPATSWSTASWASGCPARKGRRPRPPCRRCCTCRSASGCWPATR
jgi:inner membrane transporter RhtA